ncbi:MAG: fumarate hydratase [Candidatus Cloacimonetes bacterium]|nr:fumarate hydratase [Candidatus Cloacimonadota bacterium]
MRIIPAAEIHTAVTEAIGNIAYGIDPLLKSALERALAAETSATARDVLSTLLENAAVSGRARIPYCQDTGTVVVFAGIGNEVLISGALLDEIINSAVSDAWKVNYLRPSIVCCPLSRTPNSGDNTPAVIHHRITAGDKLHLSIALKGGGAENMSAIKMLSPTASEDEIIGYVTEIVTKAGGKACPPVILGIGIGGNFETAAMNAKHALFVPLDSRHPDDRIARLEQRILQAVNATGIGPQGMGGKTTALAVHVITAPCHIASLPVAINLQCHAHRHCEIIL